ncbi:MAG: D-alanyl-D-alanine carboxypeptidase [Clostridia bacterium]|nr:D-alanyl-D-alanine carboxypeptidase [Clostridia bacterium]
MTGLCKGITVIMLFAFWLTGPEWVAGEELLPEISASTAILVDRRTGQVYYAKEADKQRHPASTTKILTGILAIERGRLEEEVVVGRKAAGITIGSTLNLQQGDRLTLKDLVKGALLVSANDSTVAIGEHIGGKGGVFMEMMNTKALLMGATRSNFLNTNGYSKPNHYTTAADLARMSRYALDNPLFAEIVATKESSIAIIDRQGQEKMVDLRNTNRLLGDYPGINGVKTGTTSAAGGCLVTSAVQNGRSLITVVLKSRSRYRDTVKLLNFGFKELVEEVMAERGQIWTQVSVTGGKKTTVQVVAEQRISFILPAKIIAKVEKKVELPGSIPAPVAKGQKVGTLTVSYQGQVLGQTDLLSAIEVKELNFWDKLF